MVYPYGAKLVGPLVLSGVETLAMMATKQVGEHSYINPHGDLKWMNFGRQMLDNKSVLDELCELSL